MIDPDQPFPEHDPLPDRCMFCGADIETLEDGRPCRSDNDSWVNYRCDSSVHRSRIPRVQQSRTCEAQERLRLLSRVAELEAQVAGLRDPETMRANLLRGLVLLPSGYGETGPLEERIKRLEEAGDKLAFSFDEQWLTEADIEARIDDWWKAKEAKP